MVQYQAREVVKLLKANGFREIRVVGDHHRFTDGHGRYTTVPYSRLKDRIAIGTYRSIMQQAGLN